MSIKAIAVNPQQPADFIEIALDMLTPGPLTYWLMLKLHP